MIDMIETSIPDQTPTGYDREVSLTAIEKLTKDLKSAVTTLTPTEARFLVDAYYQMQENRIRADGQIRSMGKDGEPHAVLDWLSNNSYVLETQVKKALSVWAESTHMGRWAMKIDGIGPVLAAGLMAHIDINKAPTVGHIWSFAGICGNQVWEKGKKRPWNAALKTLCWKIGESFVKVSGKDSAFYGQHYLARKAYEIARNDNGGNKERALALAPRFKSKDAKAHYEGGKLSPGHIHAQAKRWVVKLFLSHWHAEAFRSTFGKEPPLPYPIAFLGHAHEIKPPVTE